MILKPKNQEELVQNDLDRDVLDRNTTELVIPGIENLHHRPTAEIAEVLATVLKSHVNIMKVEYMVGSYIRITTF